jgi:dipeptidyl aminopeptidase/acylaminoacyl peptidase
VAFIWNGEKVGFDLYLQLVNGGNPLRLKTRKLQVSPHGRRTVPARLHPARRRHLRDAGAGRRPQRVSIPTSASNNERRGRRRAFFVFSAFSGPERGLFAVSADGGEPRRLTKPPAGGDVSPALSPDGGTLAFVRRTSTFNSGVFVMPLNRDGTTAGAAKQITSGVWDINTLDWTADGRDILFAGSAGSGNSSLWRIARDGGKPIRFPAPTMVSAQPSVARQSGRMIYITRQIETKIFKMPLGARAGEARPLIESDGDQRDLGVAPDGERIAFVSNHGGARSGLPTATARTRRS